VNAVVWSDYLCPWCYVGQDRTALLQSLDVEVTVLPYELHPEVPVGGRPLQVRYRAVAAECEAVGMPFRPPTVLPNTRRVLTTAEWVRRSTEPVVFEALHAALFRAYFAEGLDIGDPDVLNALVRGAGADPDAVDTAAGTAWLDESMAAAREAGVTGTPAWQLSTGFVIPGVQSREFYERIVARSGP